MKRPRKHLEITCTATDCGNGLHCFRATSKMVKEHRQGECCACGANPDISPVFMGAGPRGIF
jgi:hypothetical protein